MPILEGLTVRAPILETDSGTFDAAAVEATPEHLRATFRDCNEDGRVSDAFTFTWDRPTAERVARAILAELATTRR